MGPREVRGYEAYLEGRVLALATQRGRHELEAHWKGLRRGGYVGGEGFVGNPEQHREGARAGRRRDSHSGQARAAHDEAAGQRALQRGLAALGAAEAPGTEARATGRL